MTGRGAEPVGAPPSLLYGKRSAEMKNKSRLLAAALACVLGLTGCGPRRTEPGPEPAGPEAAE